MIFRHKTDTTPPPFTGVLEHRSGHEVALLAETLISQHRLIQNVPQWTLNDAPVADAGGEAVYSGNLQELAGRAAGAAMAGERASLFAGELLPFLGALTEAAGQGHPLVIHLSAFADRRAAAALFGSHDAYLAAAGTGALQLFATNAQEVSDFAYIARHATESALLPVVCAQDLYDTSHAMRPVHILDRAFVAAYLGNAGDAIENATPAQQQIFGSTRRRVPRRMDSDHPAGTGGFMGAGSYPLAAAGFHFFQGSHGAAAFADAFQRFGELTGRHYAPLESFHAEDADYIVIAQGAIIESLKPVVLYLRAAKRIKVGLVNVRTYRPFPGAALSHLLAGKKAVTILERCSQPLAESLPLSAEVHAVLSKVSGNGHERDDTPLFTDYAQLPRRATLPAVYTGTYGVGGALPAFDECRAVFENMRVPAQGRRFFYMGVNLTHVPHGFPHLQTLQQTLRKAYPDMAAHVLPALPDKTTPGIALHDVGLYAAATQGGLFAGNTLVKALAGASGNPYIAYAQGGLEHTGRPAYFALTALSDPEPIRDAAAASVLVSNYQYLDDGRLRDKVADHGSLFVAFAGQPEALAPRISPDSIRWINERQLTVYAVDIRQAAAEVAPQATFTDQLAIWTLFGACFGNSAAAGEGMVKTLADGLRVLLGQSSQQPAKYTDSILAAFTTGAGAATRIPGEKLVLDASASAPKERSAPWTLEQVTDQDGTAFDAKRFWRSAGYLHASGHAGDALADPFVASGIMPARSSAWNDMTPLRLRLPVWLPERCTGCGSCWTSCPESALPSTVQPVAAIIQTGIGVCEKEGPALLHLPRLVDHLSRQAQREIAGDELRRHQTIGTVLDAAFEQLLQKMNVAVDQRATIQDEFGRLRAAVDHVAIARTETFFEDAERATKGTGALLSIALHVPNCTSCGICIQECPETAIEWAATDAGFAEKRAAHWQFQMALPDTESRFADKPGPYRLLQKQAYNTLAGGDGSFPGNGAKTALHLVAAAAESVMQERYAAHRAHLDGLITRLEEAIQSGVSGTVQINDFDAFARQLSTLDSGHAGAESLIHAMHDGGQTAKLDEARLKRQTAVLLALRQQRDSYAGNRARLVMVIASRRILSWGGTYPLNPFAFSWFGHTDGGALSVAEGLYSGLLSVVRREWHICREAEWALQGLPPDTREAPLPEDVLALVPPVFVTDSGGEAARTCASPILHVSLYDNPLDIDSEALPGAGIHFLQSAIGHAEHLIEGVRAAVKENAPARLRIYATDPHVSAIQPSRVIRQARLAAESRAFPLLERMAGPDAPLEIAANPDAHQDWMEWTLKTQSPSGATTVRESVLTLADWAVHEGRYAPWLTLKTRADIPQDAVPLSDYVDASAADTEDREVFIELAGAGGRPLAAVVSRELADLTRAKLHVWRGLRRGQAPCAPAPVASVQQDAPPPVDLDVEMHARLTGHLLKLCGYEDDPEFFTRPLREFSPAEHDNNGES